MPMNGFLFPAALGVCVRRSTLSATPLNLDKFKQAVIFYLVLLLPWSDNMDYN